MKSKKRRKNAFLFRVFLSLANQKQQKLFNN